MGKIAKNKPIARNLFLKEPAGGNSAILAGVFYDTEFPADYRLDLSRRVNR